MTLTVLLFASYAEAFGARSIDVSVPSGGTIDDLLSALRSFPGASALPAAPAIAVNHHLATSRQRLQIGDEVALLPPVAGG